MEEVLEDIGLGHLKQVFERHRITPRIVLAFTEEEFAAVGITSIGDRVRLRERCQHIERAENGETSSLVLRRIQEFQSKRRRGSNSLSFLQDGPGSRFLNGNVFDLITDGETDLTKFDIDMLPFDIKTIVQQLKDVNSDEDREAFLASHGDWLVENGLTNIWRLKCEEKEAVIQKIIKQVIYYRCSAEIADFIVGLNDVGNFFDLVKRHPRAFKEEFCCKPEPLTMDSFQNVYTVIYSEVGSNDKVKEDETIYAWELFLQDIEEKAVDISFEDLLGFATGANKIPQRGFQKPLEIHFFSEINRLPCVSTCAMELYLPRGIKEPKVFNDKMYMAIKGSLGFDKI